MCIKIQKVFRLYVSKKKLGEKLYDRELNYRMDCITVLGVEEEFAQDRMEKVMKNFLKKDYKNEAVSSATVYHDSLDEIAKMQVGLVDMTRQIDILSPRAIAQGWYQTLHKNTHELRIALTKKKIKCFFDEKLASLSKDKVFEIKVEEIESLSYARNRIKYAREQVTIYCCIYVYIYKAFFD
jgi:hypothetical protein